MSTGSGSVEDEYKAIQKDLSSLFTKFDKTGSVRYEDFCEIWRSLKFSRIHCGRRLWHEKKMGTERLFRIISKYLTDATSFQFRVAAIYTLYAAYHTQICEVKTKIRLTPAMWKEINKLRIVAKEQQHLDVEYIINQMVNERVFIFCAMPFPLEYLKSEFMLSKEDYLQEEQQPIGYEPDDYVQDLVENLDIIEKVSKVEEDYASTKEKILSFIVGEHNDESANSTATRLRRIEENLHGTVLDYAEDFHQWLVTKTAFGKHKTDKLESLQKPAAEYVAEEDKEEKQEVIIQEETDQKESKPMSRAEQLEALKMKAFKMTVQETKTAAASTTAEENDAKDADDTNDTKEDDATLRRTFYRRSAVREICGNLGRPSKIKKTGNDTSTT